MGENQTGRNASFFPHPSGTVFWAHVLGVHFMILVQAYSFLTANCKSID